MDHSATESRAFSRESKVVFSGSAAEFFGIWIVNILLTIVTLGIYSAWAKVRTNQYFYGHTKVDGHSFRYLATGLQILKGRLIALVFFALFSLVASVNPALGVVMALLLALLMPWLLIQGLRFNLRMTSYRNLRFGFHGRYAEAFLIYLILPVVSAFTLHLLLPAVMKKIDQFVYSNISLGGQRFEVQTRYSAYYQAALLVIIATIGFLFVVGTAWLIVGASTPKVSNEQGISFLLIAIYLTIFLLFQLMSSLYTAVIRNHLYNNSRLPEVVWLKSDLAPMQYVWVMASNTLAVIFSLGLAYPWAKVRRAKLLAAATTTTVFAQADQLVDSLQQDSSVLAEQAAELFDVDLSLT